MNQPEDLLEHAGWLRGLARSLVRDTQTADDLVQDTWAAALRRPYEREARPWLGRVLRNFAKQRFRESGRRLKRERAAARCEALPSAAELAARMELQGVLVELVLSLEQPYRSTLVLRYYEGLSAAEIGRRKGIPSATVRSHLKRGLDELRRQLDEGHGGSRQAWSVVLAPWVTRNVSFAASAATTLSVLTHGILTMSTAAKCLLGGALALLAFVGARQLEKPAIEPQTLEISAGALEVAEGEEKEGRGSKEQSVDSLRSSVPPVALEPPSEAAEKTVGSLFAQVVNERLEPIANASLKIPNLELVSKPSGQDGQIELGLGGAEEGEHAVIVTCEGHSSKHLPVQLVAGENVDLGQIVLEPGGRLFGTVVDHQARPISGAEVMTSPSLDGLLQLEHMRRVGPNRHRGLHRTLSNEDGEFVLDGVSPGNLRVWAGQLGWLWASSDPVNLRRDGAPIEIRLALELPAPEELLRGLVLTPDGVPLGGGTVRADYHGPSTYFTRWATTQANGHFEVLGLEGVRTDFRVEDPGGRWSDAVYKGALAGTEALLMFEESRTLSVWVEGEKGAEFQAKVYALARSEHSSHRVAEAVADASTTGRYELREPAEPFHLVVKASGYKDVEWSVNSPGQLPETIHVPLRKLPGIHGQVLIDDEPAAGVKLKIARVLGQVGSSFEVVHHRGFPTELDPYATYDLESDEQGRFAFAPQAVGDYSIRTLFEGFASSDFRVLGYLPDRGARDIRIELSQGGSLEGRVTLPGSAPVIGRRVVASRGDGHPVVQRVDVQGLFRFERLVPGHWNVELLEDDIDNLPTTHSVTEEEPVLPWVCQVYEGEVTYYDLDFSGSEPCTLVGRLLLDGQPARGWTAALHSLKSNSQRPSERPHSVLDLDGRFELSLATPQKGHLELHAPQGGPALVFRTSLELAQGRTDWELATKMGSVLFENLPVIDASSELLLLAWDGPNGVRVRFVLEPDASGRCHVGLFPSGKVRLLRDPLGKGPSAIEEPLFVGELLPGESMRVDLP